MSRVDGDDDELMSHAASHAKERRPVGNPDQHRAPAPRRDLTCARDPRLCLIVFLTLLSVYRFSLVTRGHFAWSDERCYTPAGKLVDALLSGDARGAISHLYTAGPGVPPGRPGFVLVAVVGELCQRAAHALGGAGPESIHYYDSASALNVVVTLGVSVLVYALGCHWSGSRWYGLLACVVYSLLCNANVWIRHLVPYQVSMLFGLWALWSLSKMGGHVPCRVGRVMLAGVSTSMAYACYPGHYAFVLMNGLVALLVLRPKLRSVLVFGGSALSVMVTLELGSRFVGGSYLGDLRTLSSSIGMGDLNEGYVFAWRYLRDVEGIAGIVLGILFAGFVVLVLWRREARLPRAARVALAGAVACYLLHASMGVLFGKMVFYGRVLMVFLPMLVVGAVLGLMHVRWMALRRAGVGLLGAASAYSFACFAVDYSRVTYPGEFLDGAMRDLGRDVHYPPNVLWDRVARDHPMSLESVDPDLVVVSDPRTEGSTQFVRLSDHDTVHETRPRFVGVNVKFMWYVRERYDQFIPPLGYELAAASLHPEVFRGAWYEGRKPWERRRLRERGYTMRLYRRLDGGYARR